MSGKGVMVIDPQLLAKISECVIVKLLFVVGYEGLGDFEMANDVFPNKVPDILLRDSG